MTVPVLVYDDDCGMCARAARLVERHADIELVGFSALSDDRRARLPEDFEQCAHLIADGTVYSCGEAMERAYELTDLPASRLPTRLRQVPGYESAREFGYKLVAENRSLVGRLLP